MQSVARFVSAKVVNRTTCSSTAKVQESRRFASSSQLEVKNPYTQETIKVFTVDNPRGIRAKFEKAVEAQRAWAKLPLSKRMAAIQKFSDLIKEKTPELAATLTNARTTTYVNVSEMGKPITQSTAELKATPQRIQFFLDNVESVLSPRVTREKKGLKEEVRQEPLGVIANISAWNYPWFVGTNVFVPALLAGNAVLYKPSEYATMTGMHIADLLYQAGVPQEIFVPIIGTGRQGEQLLACEFNGVYFTGSYATGRAIMERIGSRMIRLQMELGGKDPAYVCEDVDVVATAKALADGAMYNTGQSCCSVERIYVHKSIAKQFTEEFVKEVKSFKIGDPMDESTYIGPLTLPGQPAFLDHHTKDAMSKGAHVLLGGKKMEHPRFFEPTVLGRVNHYMASMKEESFGPIIGIMEVNDDKEAIHLMNDTRYGLTAAVYTKDKKRAENILQEVDSGTAYYNACDRVSPFLPWTGRRNSGIGATLGTEGILNFSRVKAYHWVGE